MNSLTVCTDEDKYVGLRVWCACLCWCFSDT